MSVAASTSLHPAWQSIKVDPWLFWIPCALISFGLIMVASSSIDFAAANYADPWYFAKRHAVFVAIAMLSAMLVLAIPSNVWNQFSIVLLFAGLMLLAAVLVPGIGKEVNGARRWFALGPFTIQASELAKFCFIVFFASYLARRTEEFQYHWGAFFKLICILGAFVFLLLLEPDFGSSVVLCFVAGAMMFAAGVPIIRFILLTMTGILGLALLAVISPYRWKRLVTFLDPWSQQFDDGYQLVQSLIAFGRGEWMGLGLGNSLQKLFFLPEAHTDFIFAIIAEELGLIGALLVIVAFVFLIFRIFLLALESRKQNRGFAVLVCVGIGSLFAAQAFINMGVASGLLPTKGLTLPFISSGGSSLIVSCSFVALLLRLSMELKR